MNRKISKISKIGFGTAAGILFALAAIDAHAAPPTPAMRCEMGKLTAVATYSSCRLRQDANAITKGLSPNFTNCEKTMTAKFPKLESIAGVGVCPTEHDIGDIRSRTDIFESEIAILLDGGTLPASDCGDGNLTLGEQCEVGNLAGQTCASQGFAAGTLRCGPGCAFDTSGCQNTRFEDAGSTVIDHLTGLEWEKKSVSDNVANLADAHDVDNTYTWALGGSNTTSSGTVFSNFLVLLNGVTDATTIVTSGCFANHCDWRIPTIDELKSIAVLSPGCGSAPCVQDGLLAPMRSGRYWSDSSRNGSPKGAYFLDFSIGAAAGDFKTTAYFVRAVRTAS